MTDDLDQPVSPGTSTARRAARFGDGVTSASRRGAHLGDFARRHLNTFAVIEHELAAGPAGEDRARDFIRRASGVVESDATEREEYEQYFTDCGLALPVTWTGVPVRVRKRTWVRDLDWYRNACAVLAHVAAHGRLPSQRSKDPGERRLSEWVNTQRRRFRVTANDRSAPLTAEQRDLLAEIPGFTETRDSKWEADRKQVLAHVAAHGRLPSRYAKDPDERRLSVWVGNQRARFRSIAKAGAPLTAEQRGLLAEIPGFIPADHAAKWEADRKQVLAHVAAHGKMPSQNAKDPEERRLGQWVNTQRARFRGTATNRVPLTDAQRDLLTEIPGFIPADYAAKWEADRQLVLVYVTAHGRLPSQHSKDPDERRLGEWVVKQRRRFRGTANDRSAPLTAEQRDLLTEIPGFAETRASKWEADRKLVLAFVAAHGRLPSKNAKDPDERRLGKWVDTQRARFRGTAKSSAPLTAEQRGLLAEVSGFIPADHAAKWEADRKQVLAHVAAHGKMPSQHAKDPDERRLGQWVDTQRARFRGTANDRSAPLTAAQRGLLAEIPGFTETRASKWEADRKQVLAHVAAHGRLPSRYAKDPDERRLGPWVVKQRARFRGTAKSSAPLTAAQRDLLTEIPGFLTKAMRAGSQNDA